MNSSDFRRLTRQASERSLSGFGLSTTKRMKAASALKHGLQSYHVVHLAKQDPYSDLLREASGALHDLDSVNPMRLGQALVTLLQCYSTYADQLFMLCNPLDVDGQMLALQGMLNRSMLSQEGIDEGINSLCRRLDRGVEFSSASDMVDMFANASVVSGLHFY